MASKDVAGKQQDVEVVIDPLSLDEEANKHLVLTASRHAHWSYSAFHNVTAMVGAGVLGLPSTFVYLGWGAGMVVMVLSLLISWYTFRQLVYLHEVPQEGEGKPPRRLNRYHELTIHAWGRVKGSWAILPFQIGVMVGLGITYTVTGGSSLHSFYTRLGGTGVTKTHWIIIFSVIELFLAQLPSFNHLSIVSFVGAIVSLGYSIIAIVLSAATGVRTGRAGVSYAIGRPGDSTANYVFGVFNAVSTVAFAYGGHNVALEIQSTLPWPPSTVKPMMYGVNVAYAVTFFCYFGVAIAGYAVYGNTVASNVLDSIREPLSAILVADMFVVAHVAASYQVYSYPIFDMIGQACWKRGLRLPRAADHAIRVAYVCFTCFIACLIPFFGDLMGLVGALGVTPTTFLLPAILWLYLRRPRVMSLEFAASAFIIFVCMLVGVLGTIGSMQLIVVHASEYTLFS